MTGFLTNSLHVTVFSNHPFSNHNATSVSLNLLAGRVGGAAFQILQNSGFWSLGVYINSSQLPLRFYNDLVWL